MRLLLLLFSHGLSSNDCNLCIRVCEGCIFIIVVVLYHVVFQRGNVCKKQKRESEYGAANILHPHRMAPFYFLACSILRPIAAIIVSMAWESNNNNNIHRYGISENQKKRGGEERVKAARIPKAEGNNVCVQQDILCWMISCISPYQHTMRIIGGVSTPSRWKTT